MSDFNMNNQYTPAEPQFSAPSAPAAPAKKALPTKTIAIAAIAVAAIILLISLFGSGVPSKVKKELQDRVEDTYGYKVKGLDVEIKLSSDGVKMYYITGQFKGEVDEDFEAYEDYEGGYFRATAYKYKDEVYVALGSIYEKDDKDDFKDDVKDMKDDFDSESKEIAKEFLSEMAEFMKEDDYDIDEAFYAAALSTLY